MPTGILLGLCSQTSASAFRTVRGAPLALYRAAAEMEQDKENGNIGEYSFLKIEVHP